ncbi:MAG: metallophosphoesterase family protein [Candidatus Cyclobacteriaceae bacterium M3_2C_046]
MSYRRDFIKESMASLGLWSLEPFKKWNPIMSTPQSLRFAVASDGHFGQPDTDYEMYFENLVQWINQEKAQNGLDVFFINGDLIHDLPERFEQVKPFLDRFELPLYISKGNHDRVSEETWEEELGYPVNHYFEWKNCGFLVGTTSNLEGEYLCAQLDWLNSALTNLDKVDHGFVFLHISQSKWTRHGVDCPAVMKLLDQHPKVRAVFHGHDHQEHHIKYAAGGTPFVYDGHFGGSWGQEYKGYRIVEISEPGQIITWQVNPLAQARLMETRIFPAAE